MDILNIIEKTKRNSIRRELLLNSGQSYHLNQNMLKEAKLIDTFILFHFNTNDFYNEDLMLIINVRLKNHKIFPLKPEVIKKLIEIGVYE